MSLSNTQMSSTNEGGWASPDDRFLDRINLYKFQAYPPSFLLVSAKQPTKRK